MVTINAYSETSFLAKSLQGTIGLLRSRPVVIYLSKFTGEVLDTTSDPIWGDAG